MLQLVSPPSDYCVSVDELKAHLQLSLSDWDAQLLALIASAQEYVERRTGRSLSFQTWAETFEDFPRNCYPSSWSRLASLQRNAIELQRSPVIYGGGEDGFVITYYDTDNQLQTMSDSDFVVMSQGFNLPCMVYPATAWPVTYPRIDAVRLEYQAGYSVTEEVSTAPALAKRAVLLLAGSWFSNREDESDTQTYTLDVGLERIISMLRCL